MESDKSLSEVQNCDAIIQTVLQEIEKANAFEQFENVIDANTAFFTNCNAPELLQAKEKGQEGNTESLMPQESVQAPTNELPRNNETKEDVVLSGPSQPSKRPYRRSRKRKSINAKAAKDAVPKRSPKIRDPGNANPSREGPEETNYSSRKRPLYLENKRDEYHWYFPDYSDDEDDEWK